MVNTCCDPLPGLVIRLQTNVMSIKVNVVIVRANFLYPGRHAL
jgi:hypothetical protein